MSTVIGGDFLSDAEILARVGAITDHLLKDLPDASEQRKQTMLAKAITQKVTSKNPKNHKAKSLD